MGPPLEGDSTNAATPGVKGTNSVAGNGVLGTSAASDAVVGIAQAQGKAGVLGLAANGNAVVGISDPVNGNGTGVYGQGKLLGGNFTSPQVGILANGGSGNAVNGTSAESDAVIGVAQAQGKAGVVGSAPNGNGVVGFSGAGSLSGVVGINNATGASGITDQANGVLGTCGIAGNAIHGIGGTNAGLFDGHVQINGGLDVTGEFTCPSKHFLIDHPSDPANRYLSHCSVESSEMMNIYSGTVVTDENCTAEVALPNYVTSLNSNFRYQLTVIGQFAQAIVAAEIENDRFVVSTDRPRVKVSWQVMGIRHDAYARNHPAIVEREKSPAEKARYAERIATI